MTHLIQTVRNRTLLLTFVVLFVPFAVPGEAWATCFPTGARTPLAAGKPSLAAGAAAAMAAAADDDDRHSPAASPVGMWRVRYLIGRGPDLFDEAFQQFHAGGTEMMLSNLSPSLGNVCLGVWKQIGPRTFKMTHRSWIFNSDGTPFGTFLLDLTLRLDRRAENYSGTWVSDSLDGDDQVIPEAHFEGIARATRISVD